MFAMQNNKLCCIWCSKNISSLIFKFWSIFAAKNRSFFNLNWLHQNQTKKRGKIENSLLFWFECLLHKMLCIHPTKLWTTFQCILQLLRTFVQCHICTKIKSLIKRRWGQDFPGWSQKYAHLLCPYPLS